MNKFSYKTAIDTVTRISKAEARKLFDAGKTIALCPAKLSPVAFGGAFRCLVNKDGAGEKCVRKFPDSPDNFEHHHVPRTFDDVVENFVWYNANSNETGKYAAFYTVTPHAQASA